MERLLSQQHIETRRKKRSTSYLIKVNRGNWYIFTTFLGLGVFLIMQVVQVVLEVLTRINPG